ncbi:antibiotic biosynthesis monooxygenase family protein [Vibrio mediterranei]|nr:antibiotic biosynthesis monooxygenase [Vibrio mediterranei]
MNSFVKKAITLSLFTVSPFLSAQPVVLINTFAVDAVSEADTLAYWESARDILVQQPGYINTTLHKALSKDATYMYVNVANWESKQHFVTAISVMREQLPENHLDGVVADPNLYEVIRN